MNENENKENPIEEKENKEPNKKDPNKEELYTFVRSLYNIYPDILERVYRYMPKEKED